MTRDIHVLIIMNEIVHYGKKQFLFNRFIFYYRRTGNYHTVPPFEHIYTSCSNNIFMSPQVDYV